MSDDEGSDYKTTVRQYGDEELLVKERSKRRRKTGDVVGAGLTAVAAMKVPTLWAAAGASAKSYLDNSSKHKVIMKEITRRGLKPIKGDVSDAVAPIVASAGSMVVGRALGGTAGQGLAGSAGNVMHNITNRAFGGSSKSSKKDKKAKHQSGSGAMVPYRPQTEPVHSLQAPSSYHLSPNQAPPETLTYRYVPPSAQYPNGCYAPVIQAPQVAAPMAPQPMYQQPAQHHQRPAYPAQQPAAPPALMYHYTPAEPQSYSEQSRGWGQQQEVHRAQTFYDPPPTYQRGFQRAYTTPYA